MSQNLAPFVGQFGIQNLIISDSFKFSAPLDGLYTLVDKYEGKETMKEGTEKKYLIDIISDDMKNEENLKDKISRAVGTVN